jgi:hypothetical protein
MIMTYGERDNAREAHLQRYPDQATFYDVNYLLDQLRQARAAVDLTIQESVEQALRAASDDPRLDKHHFPDRTPAAVLRGAADQLKKGLR